MDEEGYKHRKMDEPIDDNYGLHGEFLVTICTGEQSIPLSTISKGKTILTEAGKIAEKYLSEISTHFSGCDTEAFVIMPDHIQAIISIDASPVRKNLVIHDVSRFEISFGLMVGRKNPFLLKGSIFHIITWFKAASLIEIRKESNVPFSWKPGYFDFSINNPNSFKAIKKYLNKVPERALTMADPKLYFKENIFPLIRKK